MDRAIQQNSWSTKKILPLALAVLIVALIGSSIYFTSGNAKLNIDPERISISEVTKGPFREYIPVNGIVLPLTTIYLDALEGGRVEEKFVEDGAVMKKGQPIMRLSNTDLALSLVTQETQVYNLLTQMQIARNAAEQNTVNRLNQVTDVDNQLKEAKRIYELNKHLYEQKAIGLQEFKQSENTYNYQLEKKRLAQQIIKQDSVSTRQGIEQAKQLFEGSRNALELTRKKVGDLIVRAPIDGQLTSMDAEIGQNKRQGERLGQIDVLNGFKVRADIDEHYISRVFIGLMGDFSFANKRYLLKITKIYTQVTAGRFQVDMQFAGEVPKGIRRGQTLQIGLALSDETQAILIPKGGFFQQTGGNWIFKLTADGNKAYRTDIQLNRQNPDYYEVVQGLKPGEKVITSSYDHYGSIQEIILKK
ncbi:MAG TPA: HlyD family efflux transporter periplasmic adaptor subunit [Sediminibacterium sp.]|nr:HlyD family efflux transporter periplasmic adaptor subunit [Sediminibacterium sp.]